MSARPRARLARTAAAGLTVLLLLAGVACSDADEPDATGTTVGPTLPFDAPSKAELGESAGIEFPDSVAEYRSVQIGPSQLDVTFTIAASDVDAFADGSGLGPLVDDQRVVAHSSPLWELNPDESIRGAESEHDGIMRTVEVVGDGDPLTVRLSVSA